MILNDHVARIVRRRNHLVKSSNAFLVFAAITALLPTTVVADTITWTTIAGTAGSPGSADGIGSAAQFSNPLGVTADSSGNVYVADAANHTIRKLSLVGASWVATTIAGASGIWGSADGVGSAARFNGPRAIAADKNGNLFVVDVNNLTIRELTPAGTNWAVTTIAGLPGNPAGSTDGPGQFAQFNNPSSIAVDSGRNLYVADTGNQVIRKLTQVGTDWIVSTIAGLASNWGSSDGVGSAARFHDPRGIAADGNGNLYVTDAANYTIRKLTPVGTNWAVSTIAGQRSNPGSADGTNNAAWFNGSRGICVDISNNVYVADTGNSTIRKLAPIGTNWVVSTIGGTAGSSGSADGVNGSASFNGPYGIAADTNGNLYVTDTANYTVRRGLVGIVLTGTLQLDIYPPGAVRAGACWQVDGSPWQTNGATVSGLPVGTHTVAFKNLYGWTAPVTLTVTVQPNQVTARTGGYFRIYNFTTIAGKAGIPGSDDGIGSAARFAWPAGIAVDSRGTVYVGERISTIRKLVLVGTNWAVTTIAGQPWKSGSADGLGNTALFQDPRGINLDNSGNLYVADTGNGVRRLTPSGTNWIVSTIGGAAGSGNALVPTATGIAVDGSGILYVASEADLTVSQLTPVGTNWVLSAVAGRSENQGRVDGIGSAARFVDPENLALDNGGRLYVADTDLVRQLKQIGTNWAVVTIADVSEWPFADVFGVASDSDGTVYFSQAFDSVIRQLIPVGSNWVMGTIGGTAKAYGGNDGIGSAAQFNQPWGIAVDNAGRIFVADTSNNTIRLGVPLDSMLTPPAFRTVSLTNRVIFMSWTTVAGPSYQVQYTTDLASTNWLNLGDAVAGTTNTMSTSDTTGYDANRFYRVVLLP